MNKWEHALSDSLKVDKAALRAFLEANDLAIAKAHTAAKKKAAAQIARRADRHNLNKAVHKHVNAGMAWQDALRLVAEKDGRPLRIVSALVNLARNEDEEKSRYFG